MNLQISTSCIGHIIRTKILYFQIYSFYRYLSRLIFFPDLAYPHLISFNRFFVIKKIIEELCLAYTIFPLEYDSVVSRYVQVILEFLDGVFKDFGKIGVAHSISAFSGYIIENLFIVRIWTFGHVQISPNRLASSGPPL